MRKIKAIFSEEPVVPWSEDTYVTLQRYVIHAATRIPLSNQGDRIFQTARCEPGGSGTVSQS